jgi:hypothetical protein
VVIDYTVGHAGAFESVEIILPAAMLITGERARLDWQSIFRVV